MQQGASMSHISKKRRLNKPLSIYTPPLLQQRSHQAQAVHQSNRLSTLLQCEPKPRTASATGAHPPPLFFSAAAAVFLPRFGKLIPVKSGLGRETGASAAELRAGPLCQELSDAQLPKFTNPKGYGKRNVKRHLKCPILHINSI